MAGGNLGDLFVSLGIKDEMSKTLQKIVKGMNGVDQATQDAKKHGEELVAKLNQVNGNNFSKIFREANEYIEKNSKGLASIAKILNGLGGNNPNGITGKFIGAGDLTKIASLFGTINSELQRMSKNEETADMVKVWQDRISNALAYIKLLQDINIQEKKINATKSENPNVDTKSLDNAKKSLNELRESIISLTHKGGIDDSNVLGSLSKVLGMAKKDIQDIISTFKKDNPLSAFTGGAAKVEADIARVTEKLARLRDLFAEGTTKGYNTSMLGGSITELDNILSRLNAAKLNPTMLTDAAQMKNLISDVLVETVKATAAMQAYGREKAKSIELDRNSKKEWADKVNSGFKGGRFATPGSKEAAQGYLDIANAYKRALDTLQTKHSEANTNLKKLLDEYNKEIKELESKIKAISPKMDGLYWNGKKLSQKQTVEYEELVKQLEHLKNTKGADTILAQTKFDIEARKIQNLINLIKDYEQLAERVAKGVYKPYDANSYEQKRISETAALKNAIIERYKAEQDAAKKAAKEEAQAKRDEIAAEKQRQAELKNTERRYDSLGNKVRQLRSEYSRGISIGADVSKAEAEIKRLIDTMRVLRLIRDRLYSADKWKDSLGMLGNVGNGHDTTLASRVLQDQRAVNREVQKGIELEQKRQQEISKTAAKVQSDLVRGFEAANRHASGLNSTVRDLKSLFLQGGLVFGAQQFAMSIITTGGEMEKQHIALQSILGDLQNANTMFAQTKELALNSPFTFSELNRDVKQLAAYGVKYEDLYDTTKRLADMASGLGVGFDRIALAYGQVQARGWLDGKELRQIAYAGIPLLGKLSEMYSKREGRTVTTSEIKKMISAREVGFEDVKQVFWDMTNEGGQFYNMQLTLSETLLGRYNKLKDAWEIMLSDFASGNSLVGSFFKTAIEGVTTLVQSMHTLSMPLATIFAGYALKKALAGNAASGFLSNKASIASDIQKRVLQGEQISQIEQRILVTKNQITGADLRALANARALTTEKLDQLMLSGKITAEQYKTYRGIVLRQTGEKTARMQMLRTLVTMRSMTMSSMSSSLKGLWSGFATSALASFRLIGSGIKALGATIWSAIGGLPGLIMTGLTFGIMYAVSEYQDLSRRIGQTQDELSDKLKQIRDFLNDNSDAYSKAINSGSQKEIDALIEAYKEKLKELAPYNYLNILMGSEERKDHKERLKYLDEEIRKLKEVQAITKTKLDDRGTYSSLEDEIEKFSNFYKLEDKGTYEKIKNGADKKTARWELATYVANQNVYNSLAEDLKKQIEKAFGDISKSDETRLAANQAMNSVFSSLGISDDHANKIRASVMQAFGIGDDDPWLKSEVSSKMRSMIDEAFPEIGAKIRASIPLNDAEKAKVKQLMDGAKKDLIYEYPTLESTLQGLLARSKFEAVISLVFQTSEKSNDVQSELIGRIPSVLSPEISKTYRSYANKWGKDNSWYSANNAANADVDKAKKEYLSALKDHSSKASELKAAWETTKQAHKDLLGYSYEGEGKKSNKPGRSSIHKEDEQLKRLKERISLYKKMYEEINKFKSLYGTGALAKLKQDGEFSSIFGDKTLFPISDYENYEKSINELLKTIPANTKDRQAFVNDEHAGIQSKNRALEQEAIKDGNKELSDRLNLLVEEYETYKKLYEVTGDKNGSMTVAFGGIVQYDSIKDALKAELEKSLPEANEVSGNKYTSEQVLGMSETDFKKAYGEDSKGISVIYNLYRQQSQKVKKETLDLLTNIIEKNATIAQQIEDENRSYERQKQLIAESDATPEVKERAKEGLKKTHNETLSKLQFEQFKQESDWVAIFDDLDRVSSATINSMIEKIDQFSTTTGLSVESIKQLRDALDKLRNEQISRNPFPSVFGGVKRGNAIGKFIKERLGGMDDTAQIFVSKAEAKKLGIASGVRTKASLKDDQQSAYADSSKAISSLSDKMQALSNIMDPVVNLFKAMGEEDSILGQIAGGASSAFSSAANVAGGLNALGLEAAGPYGAAAAAALSIGGSLIKAFGADYSSYKKAKEEYDNLTSIWDSLISKKTEYMNIHWGTEATAASKEAQEMLKAEIEQTKIIAQMRLGSGTSAGSHSIGYRMWKGSYKYNGQNWRDVAPEISQKYGVQFNGMEDLLNMDADTLSKIKQEYVGLWSTMDSDFKDYLEKLIEYGEKADDMIEALTEKLTGNKFSDLVSSWGDAMSTMANKSDSLVDHFEENLKKTILNSMIENIYGDKIKALLEKTKKYAKNGDNIKDENGNVISEYTASEYADVKGSTDDLAKQIEATRDYLKKTYGWSDNSSSSSRNSVKSITEETGDLIASYLNAIRLDVSVMRAEQAKYYPEMSEIAKSQLTQLNAIAINTLRNADAAERIEATVYELNSNFNRVINGTKQVYVK